MSTGNKTVIVTGVSNGIGFAIADAYLRRGYNVVGNAHTPERVRVAARLGNPDRFAFLAGDISKPATVRVLFDTAIECFGKIDILINNASVFIAKRMADYTSEDMEHMVDTSLRGFIYPSQKAAKHMSANRQGHIVNITASIAMRPDVNVPALLPSLIAGGIHHATRSLAIELAAHNVKVNVVAPALVNTPLHAAGTLESFKGLPSRDPIGTAQQIVDAVLHVTDSEFVTGMVIPADDVSSA
jgi:NAD(P)-dependent dehydrogenase (short-subunit alcohol dehydrogenase family)